jgi:hypothetical protein
MRAAAEVSEAIKAVAVKTKSPIIGIRGQGRKFDTRKIPGRVCLKTALKNTE